MITGKIDPRLGNQCRQTGNEIHRLEGHLGCSVSVRREDGSLEFEWGCNNIAIPGADRIEIGAGEQNTAEILAAQCAPESQGNALAADVASNYTLNGYGDWFLPSRLELGALWKRGSEEAL